MFNLDAVNHLMDERVRVTCIDGTAVVGIWDGWTSAQDNEPDEESILIDRSPGLTEIYISEIKSIVKA